MKILRVSQKVYPEVKGGGPYHVHAMSRDQAAAGHDVTVLTVGTHGEETRDGYQIIRRPASLSLLGNDISGGLARYLLQTVRSAEYDVVHAHSHLYFSTNVAAFLCNRMGPPLALTNHGLYSQTAPSSVFDVYLKTLGKWTFDRADAVFCYTETDRDRLRELGVSSNIEVVANGIDTTRFTPKGKSADTGIGYPALLFVGRLVEGKRPLDAIRILEGVRERHPNASLLVCGEGPLRPSIEAMVDKKDLDDAVTFLGHVAYEKMPKVYRSADVLVLSSRAEGLPRSVLEALASDIPVVVSNLNQVVSLVEDVGRTAPVGDIEQFVEGVESVLSGTKQSPRSKVISDYDWTRTVDETSAVLERLA